MMAPAPGGGRDRFREALQVILAFGGLFFVLSALDIALYEGLSNGRGAVSSRPMACVISAPLAERVQAGDFEAAPEWHRADEPAGDGELGAALARVKSRVGAMAGGQRVDGVSYVTVAGVADLVGGELHQASAGAPARLICHWGIIEFIPFSRTARRNFQPRDMPHISRIIDECLYVPVRGLNDVLPVSARWNEAERTWLLSCGERSMRVASPEDLFQIEIDRSSRTLEVRYAGERLVLWSCCVGAGNNTPVGDFHIQNRAQWPPWRAYWGEYIPGGSPRNPLGARWLGTTARGRATGWAIGIHGTNQPSSIGRRISGGCVRLTNAHAIEMYDTIPIGTRVVIHE
ncbi:MAG: L,D-transpeptidase [Armatimonadota bacterium]